MLEIMKQRKLAQKEIFTRFGKIVINLELVIHFPQGLIGMPNAQNFCLAHYPENKYDLYKLLQSTDDDNLCFLSVPLAPSFYSTEDSLISNSDIMQVTNSLNYNRKNLQILLITTIHNENEKIRVSVNLKAPLIIDTITMKGYQHIFHNDKYPVQYFI
jgi:flagellar assembly factor FliW